MNDVIFSDVLLVPFRFRSFPSSSGPSWPVTPWQWSLATLLGTKLRCRPMFSPFPLTFLWATSMIDVLWHRLNGKDSLTNLFEHGKAIHSKDIHRQYVDFFGRHACCSYDLLRCHVRTRDTGTMRNLAKPGDTSSTPSAI